MRKVLLFLDDETGEQLERKAKQDYRSMKATAEKIVTDAVRADGFSDSEYMRLKNSMEGK